jgi:hypothetical protein
VLLYFAQALDAEASARAFAHGRRETNPLMEPFSHGGFVTMMDAAGSDTCPHSGNRATERAARQAYSLTLVRRVCR